MRLALAMVGLAALGSVGAVQEMTLKNWDNMQYTIPITIGTPPQKQLSLPDSGSVELVVLGGHVANHNSYDADHSNTSKIPQPHQTREITYGSGTAYGVDGSDMVGMGGKKAKVDMLMEKGGAASAMQGGLYYGAAYDGVMGLGVTDGGSTAVLGGFHFKEFTFDLSKEKLVFDNTIEGQTYKYSTVCGNGYWATKMSAVCVPQKHCDNTTGVVLIDSGTSLAYLPPSVVKTLRKTIFGNSNQQVVSCHKASSLPAVSFTIGGHEYTMKPQDYLIQAYKSQGADDTRNEQRPMDRAAPAAWLSAPPLQASNGNSATCELVFQEGAIMTQDGPMSILGMAFMRRHAVSFKRKTGNKNARIGITDYISHGSKAHRRRSQLQVRKHAGRGGGDGALEATTMDGEPSPEELPLLADISKAIPPFRSARHAPKSFTESKYQAQAPPDKVVAAREAHYQRTGEQFEWWVDLDQM